MDRISRALEQARKDVSRSRNRIDSKPAEPREYKSTRKVSLSRSVLRENRIFVSGDGPIVDKYGLLRTRVLKAMKKNNWRTLGISSADPSVGKTMTAINLAISIALDHNYSTLLVDTDLRRPGVSKALGLDVEAGLSDYLNAQKSLQDIFINPEIEHLVIAPTKRVESGTSELLSSPRMTAFIDEAKVRYPDRLVIFDLPPVLVGDDVVALSQHLDTILLVVEEGKTQTNDLTRVKELLHDINILGVVLNKGKVVDKQYDYYV